MAVRFNLTKNENNSQRKPHALRFTDFKVDPGADDWQKGASIQLDLKTVNAKK